MINELDNRMKQISEIPPIPENEQKLREQLQILYMLADAIKNDDLSEESKISELVRSFAKGRLTELENTKLLSSEKLPKRNCDLNTLLLKILKRLDKEGRRISFCSKRDRINVLVNEKAIAMLFERLMLFCKYRIMVEIKEKRIKIKSDCSFTELLELRDRESDLMLVINKILEFHSSAIFICSQNAGCEISLSLDGMLCDKTDNC